MLNESSSSTFSLTCILNIGLYEIPKDSKHDIAVLLGISAVCEKIVDGHMAAVISAIERYKGTWD